jgi:IS4 transposase
MFSSVADIMASVVCRIHPSVNAAYRARAEELGVTVKAVYDKLRGIEPDVSRAVVGETASHMASIIEKTRGALPELLPGYHVKIVDGNHFRHTDRRIAELRKLNAAPLPGQAAVVLDPRLKLATDVFLCEDGHAQERTLLPQILETVARRDLWIEDRNFCTTRFLFGIAKLGAFFVIRQHGGSLRWELQGRRKRVGEIETGVVYEQKMRIFHDDGNVRAIRRITVELFEPTRDGDTVIHILSNLPKKVGTLHIAELYRKRWTIETAFQELAENLNCEINTLGYPKAALFGFCMGLVSYNVLSVVKAALRAAHREKADELSIYYMADEIAGTYRGMMIAIPPTYWKTRFASLTPSQMAQALARLAKNVSLSKYRKNKWTPKKKTKSKANRRRRQHVSTARILERQRKKQQAA